MSGNPGHYATVVIPLVDVRPVKPMRIRLSIVQLEPEFVGQSRNQLRGFRALIDTKFAVVYRDPDIEQHPIVLR